MAVLGVGLDLVDVGRLRAAMERHPERFRSRIFTEAETAFCERLAGKHLSYAGRFAAKEAFAKALGTGLRGAVGWRDIQVNDNERSRPTLTVSGRAAAILGPRRVHLSITHLPDYAAAVVVIED
ncbi:holo-[acyl-carrier-protein] synthase [candidate division WOR-3 bacterium]|nr:holo-[acyl-carrier-protein] synthase [candidate division WOR-3 bacterium]